MRIPTISVKVVRCNGTSEVIKIPLTCKHPAKKSTEKREDDWPDLRLTKPPPERLSPCVRLKIDSTTDSAKQISFNTSKSAQERPQNTSDSIRKETVLEASREKKQEAFVLQ